MPSTTETLKIDRLDIHVARTFSENNAKGNPPLLLFNGIGANVELLLPLMESIRGRDCISFDIPGIGGSTASRLPMRFPKLAKLSNKVLDHFELSTVDALGVSWGGGLAQEFARQGLDFCRRLILVATSPGAVMVPSKPSVFLKLSTPKRYLNEGYLAEVAPEIYGGELRDHPEKLAAFSDSVKKNKSSKGYFWQLAAIVGWTSIHWLHKLQQPTLVLAGIDDPLVPLANAKIFRARIPNCEVIEVNCGHLLLMTQQEEMAKTIDAFLDKTIDTPTAEVATPG